MSIVAKLFWADDFLTQACILLIIVILIVALLGLYLPLYRRVRQSRKISQGLAAVLGSSRDATPAGFEVILGNSILNDHWVRFKAQWNDAKLTPEANRSAVSLRDVFEDYPLLGTGSRRAMLPAIPGVFLALGIFGTFVGLTLAIQGTSVSESIDADQQSQITDLINYMGLAFRTSLWGMTLSMVSALSIRWLEGRSEWYEQHISDQVERVYPVMADSEIASLNLRGQREAFDLLRNEFTTLRLDLGETLERNLEKIRNSASGIAQDATEHQRQQIQGLLADLSDVMKAGVSTYLAELQAALAETGSHQRQLAAHLETAFTNFRDLISSHEALAGRLEGASTGVESAASQLMLTAAEFAPVVDHLRAAGRSLEGTAGTIERTQQAASEAVNAVGNALITAKENLESQGALVERSLGEIRSSIEKLSRGLADDLVRALGRFDEILGPAIDRMSGTIHESNATFERLSTPLDHLMEAATQLGALLDQIGRGVAQIPAGLGPLSSGLNDLARANREVREMLERLYKQIEATDGSVNQLRVSLGERGQSLERGIKELFGRIREGRNGLEARRPVQAMDENSATSPPSQPPRPIAPLETLPASPVSPNEPVKKLDSDSSSQSEAKRSGPFSRLFGRN